MRESPNPIKCGATRLRKGPPKYTNEECDIDRTITRLLLLVAGRLIIVRHLHGEVGDSGFYLHFLSGWSLFICIAPRGILTSHFTLFRVEISSPNSLLFR